jgi:hypothetical protein
MEPRRDRHNGASVGSAYWYHLRGRRGISI